MAVIALFIKFHVSSGDESLLFEKVISNGLYSRYKC